MDTSKCKDIKMNSIKLNDLWMTSIKVCWSTSRLKRMHNTISVYENEQHFHDYLFVNATAITFVRETTPVRLYCDFYEYFESDDFTLLCQHSVKLQDSSNIRSIRKNRNGLGIFAYFPIYSRMKFQLSTPSLLWCIDIQCSII